MLTQLRIKLTQYALALFVAVFFSAVAHAKLAITLSDPEWRFTLSNQLDGRTETQLRPEEGKFASQVQPLLARQDYNAVREAFLKRPLDGDSPALQQLRGQVLLSLKRYDEAELALLAALNSLPDLTLSHRSLSLLYMVQENYPKARKHLRRSIELGVRDAQIHGQLAFVNLKTGHAASAVAGYQQALFMEPENRQWQQGLLYALLNSNAFDQAQALVEEMLKTDGKNASLWLTRGQIALGQERDKEALSSLEVALELGADQIQNFVSAAQLHLQHGSYPRAVDLLINNLAPLNTEDKNELLAAIEQIAGVLTSRGQWTQLSRLLTAVNEKKNIPARFRVDFNVYAAQLAMEQGKLTRARKALQSAVNADPSHGEALLALGDLYRQQQQAERARNLYVRAAALEDYRERALLNHAQLEVDREAYSEALRLLRRAAQISPGRSDIVSNIRILEKLITSRS